MITDCTLWRYQIKIRILFGEFGEKGRGSSVKTTQCGGIIVKTSHCAVEEGGGEGVLLKKQILLPWGEDYCCLGDVVAIPPPPAPGHKSPPGYRKSNSLGVLHELLRSDRNSN